MINLVQPNLSNVGNMRKALIPFPGLAHTYATSFTKGYIAYYNLCESYELPTNKVQAIKIESYSARIRGSSLSCSDPKIIISTHIPCMWNNLPASWCFVTCA